MSPYALSWLEKTRLQHIKSLPDLSNAQRDLLRAIAQRSPSGGWTGFLSYEDLHLISGVSVRHLERLVPQLEARGLIEVHRERDPQRPRHNLPNRYRLCHLNFVQIERQMTVWEQKV